MSQLTATMILSLGILLVLWISYFLRRDSRPWITFQFWCFTQIYCFIAILGVGMMQAHLDCASLWGDCYAYDYPLWLADFKPLLLGSIVMWSALAIGMTLLNISHWIKNKSG